MDKSKIDDLYEKTDPKTMNKEDIEEMCYLLDMHGKMQSVLLLYKKIFPFLFINAYGFAMFVLIFHGGCVGSDWSFQIVNLISIVLWWILTKFYGFLMGRIEKSLYRILDAASLRNN